MGDTTLLKSTLSTSHKRQFIMIEDEHSSKQSAECPKRSKIVKLKVPPSALKKIIKSPPKKWADAEVTELKGENTSANPSSQKTCVATTAGSSNSNQPRDTKVERLPGQHNLASIPAGESILLPPIDLSEN